MYACSLRHATNVLHYDFFIFIFRLFCSAAAALDFDGAQLFIYSSYLCMYVCIVVIFFCKRTRLLKDDNHFDRCIQQAIDTYTYICTYQTNKSICNKIVNIFFFFSVIRRTQIHTYTYVCIILHKYRKYLTRLFHSSSLDLIHCFRSDFL